MSTSAPAVVPSAVLAMTGREQAGEKSAARSVAFGRSGGHRWALRRAPGLAGVEVRFRAGQLFEFTTVKKNAPTTGALIDLHAESRSGKHLRRAPWALNRHRRRLRHDRCPQSRPKPSIHKHMRISIYGLALSPQAPRSRSEMYDGWVT